jgi:hypothetical protein
MLRHLEEEELRPMGRRELVVRTIADKPGSFTPEALVDGVVSGVVAPLGRLLMVLRFTTARWGNRRIEAIADPERLRPFVEKAQEARLRRPAEPQRNAGWSWPDYPAHDRCNVERTSCRRTTC